jgi:pectinesterase
MTLLTGLLTLLSKPWTRGVLAFLALGLSPWCARAIETGAPKRLRIVLVGDSTVTDHAGWGQGFKRYVADDVECVNTAQGGRSSKSFINEGRLTKAIEADGDYYLIQFGHNDQPGKGPDRETDPATTYPEYLTRYIEAVRAIGAQPILVTPLVRRTFDAESTSRLTSSLVPYADAMKTLGAAKNVPVIDLHASSLALCEKLGAAEVAKFNPIKDGKPDTTHLEARGSAVFAALIIEELTHAVPALARCFKPVTAGAPTALIAAQGGKTDAGKAAGAAATSEAKADAIVSADNSGTHLTVMAAVAAAPVNGTKPFVILIKPGVYKEHIHVPVEKPFITFRGEPSETAATVITGDTHVKTIGSNGKNLPTRDSATVLIQGANFTAENVMFENSTARETGVQALAIYVEADRVAFRKCRFLGWQDTVRVEKGRHYFDQCYVSGHVDFIYGRGTALFDRSEIYCRADGYITAASTPADNAWGFVFLDCRVTTAPEVKKGVYLGRPWRPHAATAFVRTELPATVRAEGWHNWGKPEREPTARYREYKNTGPGAKTGARVAWARELTEDEVLGCTVEAILGGKDGWKPADAFSK